mgnify:CR=1 FL=1
MISASLQQRKTRTRRSMLFVPGANAASAAFELSFQRIDAQPSGEITE